jgi:hypothetical protein
MPSVYTKLPRQNLTTQLGPQPWPVAVRPKSGQSGGVLGREKDGEGARAHLGLDCDRSWGCGGAGEVTRWSRAAAAAGIATPATGRRGPNNTRHREVLRTLGTRLGRLGGGGTSYNRELAVGAPMAGRRSQWVALDVDARGGGARRPFYSQGTERPGRAFSAKGYPDVNAVVRRLYSGRRARHWEGVNGPVVKGVRRGASTGFEPPQ